MKQRLFIIALLAVPLLWLFGRALVSDEMFVFRDAAHYYYPYYHYVAEQWSEGRVPLWNPLENLGQPLLADPTAAVLYPGKLIFISPLGYDTNYKLYIVGHVLLAAVLAFLAARGLDRSRSAAAVCALSYAFSGSVVFQYCNVVFLVGAAWLPLAVLATQRMLVLRDWRWALALAVVLAMMVLGGDPQIAYHSGLAGGLYALMLWWSERRREVSVGWPSKAVQNMRRPFRRPWKAIVLTMVFSRFALLAAAAGFAFSLAAVQVLPSLEWTRHTTRAATDVPRNVYELASGAGDRERPSGDRLAFLLGQTEQGHHEDTYQFSVGPWHLAGYVWPNCFGNLFPENTRWIRALPAEDRMWTPTLYMGLLPFVLALSQFALWTRRRWGRRGSDMESSEGEGAASSPTPATLGSDDSDANKSVRVWLTWLVIFSLVAGFGWYGIGWLSSEIYHAIYGADAEPLAIGWPFGGVYWLMQTLLPGYVYFRYPAKWLIITSLALALLAAYGWDSLIQHSNDQTRRFVRRALLVVLGLSMVAGVVAKTLIFDYSTWEQLCRLAPKDPLFGPIAVGVAGWNVVGALVQTIVLTALSLLLIRRTRGDQPNHTQLPQWRGALLLLFVVGDLCLAQRELLPTVSNARRIRPTISIARELRKDSPIGHPRRDASLMPMRLYRQIGPPFLEHLSPRERQRHGQERDEETLLPKYHLLYGADMLESSSAMVSRDASALMNAARRHGSSNEDGGRFPDLLTLETLGVEYYIADRGQWSLPGERFFWRYVGDLSFDRRARVVYDVVQLSELESSAPLATRRRTEEVLNSVRDGGHDSFAVVESNRQLPQVSVAQPSSQAPQGHPREFVVYTPQRVELLATLKQDGLVILADAYEANWVCEVTDLETGATRTEPILRTNRVLRGVWLPAGNYKLVFKYRPMSFYWGAAISGGAWLGLLLLGVLGWGLKRRPARLPVG